MTTAATLTVGTLLAGAVLLGGCTGPGADDAVRAALSFEQLTGVAPAQACDLLAGRTREALEKSSKAACADALPAAGLPSASSVQTVRVYGHDAQVLLDGDVVFLARFAEGWKVTAAGCRAGTTADEPYDCDVSGG